LLDADELLSGSNREMRGFAKADLLLRPRLAMLAKDFHAEQSLSSKTMLSLSHHCKDVSIAINAMRIVLSLTIRTSL
jgi:hypothetical protein